MAVTGPGSPATTWWVLARRSRRRGPTVCSIEGSYAGVRACRAARRARPRPPSRAPGHSAACWCSTSPGCCPVRSAVGRSPISAPTSSRSSRPRATTAGSPIRRSTRWPCTSCNRTSGSATCRSICARPEAADLLRRLAATGRRRAGELPARRHGPPRPRRGDTAGRQPRPDLRLAVGLRPGRPVGRPTGLCRDHPGRDGHDRRQQQPSRRRTSQRVVLPRRRVCRAAHPVGHPRRPSSARAHRRRPTGRGVDGRVAPVRQRARAVGAGRHRWRRCG